MSIRWIRNILVEGEKTTVEVMFGNREISDKCYVRVNGGNEQWFSPYGETRDSILSQGMDLLKKQFNGKALTLPNGSHFQWS